MATSRSPVAPIVPVCVYTASRLNEDAALDRQTFRVVVHLSPNGVWERLTSGRGLVKAAQAHFERKSSTGDKRHNVFSYEGPRGRLVVRFPLRDFERPTHFNAHRTSYAATAEVLQRLVERHNSVTWVTNLDADRLDDDQEIENRLNAFVHHQHAERVRGRRRMSEKEINELRARNAFGDELYEARLREGYSVDV